MRKRQTNRDWWAEHRERFERTDRLLRQRIAHHQAKLREERPDWEPPRNGDEWAAYFERKWAAERRSAGA